MRPFSLVPFAVALAVYLSACSSSTPRPDAGGEGDAGVADACAGSCTSQEQCVGEGDAARCELALPSRCTAGTRWSAGTQAFRKLAKVEA